MLRSQLHKPDSPQHGQDVDAPELFVAAPSSGPDGCLDAGQPGSPEARQGRLLGWHSHPVLSRPQGRRQLPMHRLASGSVGRTTSALRRDARSQRPSSRRRIDLSAFARRVISAPRPERTVCRVEPGYAQSLRPSRLGCRPTVERSELLCGTMGECFPARRPLLTRRPCRMRRRRPS